MKVIKHINELRNTLAPWRSEHEIAFVPTMGNLHDGHLSLVQHAKTTASKVVVSIFVNPMQFSENEDLDTYPRTLEQDLEKLEEMDVEVVFTPTASEMYPNQRVNHTEITVPALGKILCGVTRPHFFSGICIVMNKLLNIVQPNSLLLGEKDYQQLIIVKQMLEDLCMPIHVVGVPTARDADGLAMSSRNQYLSPVERDHAAKLNETLVWLRDQVQNNKNEVAALISQAQQQLIDAGFTPDYVSVRDANDLSEMTASTQEFVVLAAAWLGKTRLIDNVKGQL